jgi:glucose-1-phosphate thymidylyltransferase
LLTMSDPEHYGVVEVLINLKSSVNWGKASGSKSNFAVPGLYFFTTTRSFAIAKIIKPSARGEYRNYWCKQSLSRTKIN